MGTYLLVVDLRDDFSAIADALGNYEGTAPDASYVVLIPEQEPGEVQTPAETESRTENLHKALAAAGMPANVIISSRDVVDAVDVQLRHHHFDEVIVASPSDRFSRFFGVDMWHRLHDAFDVPVVNLRDPNAHHLRPDDFSL